MAIGLGFGSENGATSGKWMDNYSSSKFLNPNNGTGSIDQQFARKYKVKLNQIKLAENRLNQLVKNGGGQILSLPEYDQKIKKKLEELAIKCTSQSYEKNLDGKLEFINFKIGILMEKSVQEGFENDQKEKAKKDEKEQEKIQAFIKPLVDAYNKAGADSEKDNTQIKSKALDDKKKQLEKDIETSIAYVEYNFDDVDPVEDEEATKRNREDAKKNLEEAYKQVKDGVKAAENIAEQNAKKVLENCKKSLELAAEEKAKEAERKAEKALQQAAAKLANLPDDIIKQFKQIENLLQTLVTGFGDFTMSLTDMSTDIGLDAEMQIDNAIASLQSLLDPVFNTATALKLPLPPIIDPVKDLLAMIPQMGKDPPGITPDQKALIEKYKKQKIQIPQEWKKSLEDIVKNIGIAMGMFPVCLIQLIFNMIDALIGQILALGGAMPFPLNLIPLAIQLMPKLFMLYVQLPQVLYKILEKKMMDMLAQAAALGTSAGSAINGIFAPTPQCPEAVKKELETKIEAEKKAKEEQKQLEEAKKKKEKEDALKKQLEEKAKADEAYRNSPQYKKDQEEAAKQAELLAKIEASKIKTVEQKEDQENKKLCDQIINEAKIIVPNNTDDQPRDTSSMSESSLTEFEKKEKKSIDTKEMDEALEQSKKELGRYSLIRAQEIVNEKRFFEAAKEKEFQANWDGGDDPGMADDPDFQYAKEAAATAASS